MDNIKCKLCLNYTVQKLNDIFSCSECNKSYSESDKKPKTNLSKSFINKKTHLNNVLNNLENTNNEDNNNKELVEILNNTININNISKEFIDNTFISEFCKQYNKKNHYTIISIRNQYEKEKLNLSNENIINIGIVFEHFINYLNIVNNGKTKTISYAIFIYKVCSILNISKNLKPSTNKTNKNNKEKDIENFIKYIYNINNFNNKIIKYQPILRKKKNNFISIL